MEVFTKMVGRVHAALGVAIGCAIAMDVYPSGSYLSKLAVVSIAAAGSLAPDLDTRRSKAGKKLPALAFVFSKLFKHRGFLHSPACLIMLILSSFAMPKLPGFIMLVFCAGYAGHLVQDWFTKGGIPLLYPFSKKRYALTRLKTGGASDYIITFIIIMLLFTANVLLSQHFGNILRDFRVFIPRPSLISMQLAVKQPELIMPKRAH